MTTFTICYYAPDNKMGDCSDAACQYYRAWAHDELARAYPGSEIEVTAEDSLSRFWTDDELNEQEIGDYIRSLWDRCPWTFSDSGIDLAGSAGE